MEPLHLEESRRKGPGRGEALLWLVASWHVMRMYGGMETQGFMSIQTTRGALGDCEHSHPRFDRLSIAVALVLSASRLRQRSLETKIVRRQ